MKNLILLWSLVLITGMSSCKKDLLDSTPQDKYSDAAVWKDSVLVNLYVNKIYSDMPSQYGAVGDLLACFTDEGTNISLTAGSSTFNQNQATATFSPSGGSYAGFFVDIRLCNVFLDNIATLNASAGLKNRLTGEVRFLRALYYHYMYNYFGRFPILRTTLQLDGNVFIPRNTDAECIDFITSEFKAAAELLPRNYTGTNVGRATKGAAYGFLCRTYLYAGLWKDASDAAQLVMGLGYNLYPDYQALFYPQNDNNTEVIFDRQYIPLISSAQYSLVDWTNTPATYTGKSTGNINPSEDLVSMYQMKDGTSFDWNNPVMAANPYANRDPRMDATIIHDGTVWIGRTIDMKLGSVFNPQARPSRTGYYLKKFLDPAYDHSSSVNYSGQNFILMRYAEVLLNYAEAQFKLGNTDEARIYVNKVRARQSVNMPEILPGDFTWDSYVREREIELAFEGLRLWDINRWKLGPQTRGADLHGVSLTGTGSAKTYQKTVALRSGTERIFVDKMYLFPIPLSEIQKYPNKSLIQNPGWEE